MSLTGSERKEIEEIVRTVFMQEWRGVSVEITAGFVEAIDWYTNNLAEILEKQNEKHSTWMAELKAKIAERQERERHRDIPGFAR